MTLGQSTPGRDLKTRYLYLGIALMVGLLILLVRLYRLQVNRGDEFVQKSVANWVKRTPILADRGMILDSRREILVDNRPSFDVYVTPAFCQHCSDEVLPKLGAWLSWDATQLGKVEGQIKFAKRNAEFQPVRVRVDLSRDQLDIINAHLMELPGVDVLRVPHRSYRTCSGEDPLHCDTSLARTGLAHLIGYLSEISQEALDQQAPGTNYLLGNYIGRGGIESFYESKLRGRDGVRKEVVNARGRTIPELNDLLGPDRETAPKPGYNLVLSIDSQLQEEAEKKFPAQAGAVIAIDVRTGFILALVSRPAFDPNELTGRVTPTRMAALSKDPLQPMMFRATAMHYSPGSTFKPITLLAALKSGTFTPHTIVNCPGGYRLGSRTWRCHLDRGHGLKDARGALQQSCDTYFYKVADTIGLDPIAEMGTQLGLGAPTGLGVVSDISGIMPSSAYHDRVTKGGYTKGMALNSAIGQGDVNVTPLQLVNVYATIANGGTLYQPQLIKRIETAEGMVVEDFAPKVIRTLEMTPENRAIVVDGLVAVVNEAGGTAYGSRLKTIKVAGKTGTAQVGKLGSVRLKKEQMDYFDRDHAWFAAFAPAENPEIAIVVLNEHGGHGGVESAPTAMAVIQKYFDLKNNAARPLAQTADPEH